MSRLAHWLCSLLIAGVIVAGCNCSTPPCSGAACAEDSGGQVPDSGSRSDAGLEADAGPGVDGGGDAGSPVDAGVDGGSADGGVDAGNWIDAGYCGTPGSLDPLFGDGGVVPVTFLSNVSTTYIQQDGRILVGGFTGPTTNRTWALVRLNMDGSIDNSFGTAGVVTGTSGSVNQVLALAQQSDGRILVLAATGNGTNGTQMQVFRFNLDGSTDPSWAAPTLLNVYFLELDANERILVGGSSLNCNNCPGYRIARFLQDGGADLSLAGTGTVYGPTLPANTVDLGVIHPEASGDFLAVGAWRDPNNGYSAYLQAFLPDGGLDSAFGDGGTLFVDAGMVSNGCNATPGFWSTAPASGGFFAVGTECTNSLSSFMVARISDLGQLDPTFGSNGLAINNFSGNSNMLGSSAIQLDGKLVVAGEALVTSTSLQCLLARYLPDGTVDTSFNGNGWKFFSPWGCNVLLQRDGRLLLVGGNVGTGNDVLIGVCP